MSRLPNWPTRLKTYLVGKRNTPFEWGQHDCLLFAGDCVQAVTGRDYSSRFRGTYNNRASARALLRTLSNEGDVQGLLDKHLKRLPTILVARRGDIVSTQTPFGPGIGVCFGDGCAFPGKNGLVKVPLRACLAAWRVT